MHVSDWPALALARDRGGPARLPFFLVSPAEAGGESPPIRLGSVAVGHVSALRRFPDAFVEIAAAHADGAHGGALGLRLPADGRDARLAEIHAELRAEGLIRGWRDEAYPLRDASLREHATIERAASRFWGALTFGAHCNGYVADDAGRPTHLWVARRADDKPTDPGRLDNLVGGGVPRGQSPREAAIREGWEEAGLRPEQMAGLVAGRVLEIDGDVPEGRQHEWLHVFDLALPAGLVPRNIDGEVAEIRCLPLAEALAAAATGAMTTDAALTTLDFACRHGLLEPSGAWRGFTGAEALPNFAPSSRTSFEALLVTHERR